MLGQCPHKNIPPSNPCYRANYNLVPLRQVYEILCVSERERERQLDNYEGLTQQFIHTASPTVTEDGIYHK